MGERTVVTLFMHTGAALHGGDEATSGFCPGRGDRTADRDGGMVPSGVNQPRMGWGFRGSF